jgi:tRNA(Ile)-lysidine synthase
MSHPSIDDALLQALSDSIGSFSDITVAYSGGLDSCVLLHLCCSLRTNRPDLELSAIHINHGLSQNASKWQTHCQEVCASWQVQFTSASVEIIRQSRSSLEQQARDARYKAIEENVPSNNLVLLGQHLDDQAETFLLQLARGAGVDGLSAMPKQFTRNQVSDKQQLTFARPLLDISQTQLLNYAKAHQLTWVEDESNADESFNRNFIRHSVMPVLQQKWPSIATTISRSAALCAQSAELADEYMQSLAPSMIDENAYLDISSWQNLSKVSKFAMLRFWLKPQVSIMPSSAVLSEIIKMISAPEDAQPRCSWQGNIVSRYQGKLIVRTQEQELNKLENKGSETATKGKLSTTPIVFDQDGEFTAPDLPYMLKLVPHTESVSGQVLIEDYFVNSKATDETHLAYTFGAMSKKCKLDATRPSKPIKKWLQEMQIPPWERGSIPILMHADEVLALGRHVCCSTKNNKADSPEQNSSSASKATSHYLVLVLHA